MEYTYTGTAGQQLYDSYLADEAPFPERKPVAFPERQDQREEAHVLKCLMFPQCWNAGELLDDVSNVEQRVNRLGTLFYRGIQPYCDDCPKSAISTVLDELPAIRAKLKRDVEAAYKGDPAAKSYTEVIRSYPGLQALMIHRVANALYHADRPEYARELTEYAKTMTGIDLHPGAAVGEHCFIDHGAGVVMGETATVGDWVRIYQDVTLGALHFEEEEDDRKMLKKGYKRHPDVGDHVVIGAGTKILGPVTVGDHVSIGANSWITEDIPDHTKVFVAEHPDQVHKQQQKRD